LQEVLAPEILPSDEEEVLADEFAEESEIEDDDEDQELPPSFVNQTYLAIEAMKGQLDNQLKKHLISVVVGIESVDGAFNKGLMEQYLTCAICHGLSIKPQECL
jgi:hypothetical protein